MGEAQDESWSGWVARAVLRLAGPGTLREMRRRAGLSQNELAAAANTLQPLIVRYESGAGTPSPEVAERLMSVLLASEEAKDVLPPNLRELLVRSFSPNPYALELVALRRKYERKESKR